jgi:peptide/nickel transport system permease protein
MQRFIIRRLFTSLLAIIGATMIVFAVSRLLGDPRVLMVPIESYGLTHEDWERATKQLHLDKPIPVQYAYWMGQLLQGDLGRDLADRNLIAPKLAKKIMPTIKLALAAWILATVVGLPLGVMSAVRRGGVWDYAGRLFALLGQALPVFWIAILGILVFAVWLRLLPAGTMGEGFAIRNYILPTVTLGWYASAGYVRLVRSTMLEVLDSEFIKMARAKGVKEWAIVWKHAFKNAILAPLTYSGLLLGGLIGGSVAVETVYGWPGLARYAVEAVQTNNFTVLAVVTLFFTAVFIITNFFVDILYAYLDPRIRYT